MNSVKKIYKKLTGEKIYSQKEIDQLCLNITAVQKINSSKKTYKEKVNLIGRLVPEIKEILKDGEEEHPGLDILGDLVRQWSSKSTKICIDNLERFGVKSPKEVKEYMTNLKGPIYVAKKEPSVKITPLSAQKASSLASSINSLASSSKRSSSSSQKTIVPLHRRSTLIDQNSPFEP